MKSSKKKRIIKPLFLDKKPQIKLNEILFQRYKYLIEKYSITKKKYNSFMIEYLIYDEKTRLVSLFKDQLIQNDTTEVLKRYYVYQESIKRLAYYFEYYDKYSKLFPNYTPLPESKYFYKNIHKKQIILDLQQMEESTENKIEENNKNLKHKVFDSNIYNSIFKMSEDLYPTLFGINNCKTEREINKENKQIIEIVNYIEKCEKDYQNKTLIPNIKKENNNNTINSDSNKFKNLFKLQKKIKNHNNTLKQNNYILSWSLLAKHNTLHPLIEQQQKIKNAKLSIINNFYSNIDINIVNFDKKDEHKNNKRTNHSVIFKNINSLPPLIDIQENKYLNIKQNFNNCDTYKYCNKYQLNIGISKLSNKNNYFIKSNKILPRTSHNNQQNKKAYNFFDKKKINKIINQFNLSLNFTNNKSNVTKDDLYSKNKISFRKYIKINNNSKKYDKINCVSDRPSQFQRKNKYNFEIKKSQYSSNSRLKKVINKSQSRSQSKKNINQNKNSITQICKINSSNNKIPQLININLLSKIISYKNNSKTKTKKNYKNLKDIIIKNNNKLNRTGNLNLQFKNLCNCSNTERNHLNRFNINRLVLKKIIFDHKNSKTKSKPKSNSKKEKLNKTNYREKINQRCLKENTNIINYQNSLIKENIFSKYKKINIKNHNEEKSKKSNKESNNSLSNNELYFAQFSNSIEIPSLINKKNKPIELINNSNMNGNNITLCSNSSNSTTRKIKGIEIKNFKKIFSLKNDNRDKPNTSHKL